VSYPVADPRGKAVVRSQYIGRLLALFPVLAVQHFDALRAGDLRQVGTLDELLRGIGDALARHRAAPQIPLANGVAAAARWLVNAPLPARERAEILWTALRPRGLPTLDPALAARFYPGPLRLSVSQLEQFAGCPLQYFFHYTLGLRRRQTLQLDQLELGNLFHRVLELVYDEIIAKALPWPNSTPTQLRAALDDAVAAAVAELHAELADATPAYGKLRRRATASLAVVLEGQRRAAAAGDLLPIATELVFGGKADARKRALPTLSLPTPQRRTVDLTGKIDRIDATEDRGAAAVIDYKTRGKELSLRTIYFGISLQLPVYLLVLRANANWLEGPLRPVASLFVPLTVSRATKTTPADVEEPEEDRFYKRVRPRGLIDAAARDVLDHTAETASNWYAMKFKGSGELSLAGGNDAVTHDEFALILDYVQYKIGELADGLATGLIAPQPWRQSSATACDLCDFQATCPFDRVNGDFRAVPKLNRKAALERMADDVRGATHG
jgi:ATP-dependent helicase/nuclease subunit B